MRTNWGSGLLLGSLLACQLLAADPAGPAPGITIRLVNSAKVPQAKLVQGEKQAAYILGKAGVSLTWQGCSAGSAGWQSGLCASRLGATDFWLHVATWKPAAAVGEMLGFTALSRDPGTDDSVAGVYYPAVRKMAESFSAEESEILGPALAHEIGHLLGVGHAPMGVMCSQFGRSHIVQASLGGLLFSTPQASQIRTEIARRKAASEACYGAPEQIAVVIFDQAGVPAPVLKAAAGTARDAFRKVGVETDWSVCRVSGGPNEHCTLPPAGTYLEMKVLPPAMERRLQSREAMGCAMMCPRCVTSYAFYGPVKTLAKSAGQSASVVLAFVMVHEVGHLLGMGHTPTGIMKAGLTRRDIQDAAMGRLRFTEGEAKLRAAAAEREMALLAAVH